MELSPLEIKYITIILSLISGMIIAIVAPKILNKRRLFTYSVNHSIIGASLDDAIFGSVRVTWNESDIDRLYGSTIELINRSMTDFESVIMKVFTDNTVLLSAKTELVGTTKFLNLSDNFKKKIYVPKGKQVTKAQRTLYTSQREYMIPVLNRGQMVKILIVNSPNTEETPKIWLDIIHKGVKLEFQELQNLIFGVSQRNASLAGAILGLVLVSLIIAYTNSTTWVAITAFLLGGLGTWIGSILLKIYDKIRGWIAG